MHHTKLSSKGQLVIPKDIRRAHGWHSGCRFLVIEQSDGILLKPISPTQESSLDEVIGCTGYTGKRKSLADMQEGIKKGVKTHDQH